MTSGGWSISYFEKFRLIFIGSDIGISKKLNEDFLPQKEKMREMSNPEPEF
jgi:hypothetical protein